MKKIGFVDYYLDEWHANHYPAWIEQASGGTMKVAYAYGKTDAPGGLDNDAWCRHNGIVRLGTIQEVVELSDYIIVLSPDHPEFHEELADLPLRSGKPTYVDKTFAPDRAAAERLFDIARRHMTPVYSSSALRYASEYAGAPREGIDTIISMGPGEYGNYVIHQIEPIVSLMGTDVLRVMWIGTDKSPALLIEFSGGRQAEIRQLKNSNFSMSISYSSGDCATLKAESDFFAHFIQDLISFFRTNKPSVEPQETIAVITLIECGLRAAETPFRWIEVP